MAVDNEIVKWNSINWDDVNFGALASSDKERNEWVSLAVFKNIIKLLSAKDIKRYYKMRFIEDDTDGSR